MQNFLTTDVSLLMANILFLSPYVDKSQKAVVKSVGHTACLEAGLILSFGEIKIFGWDFLAYVQILVFF